MHFKIAFLSLGKLLGLSALLGVAGLFLPLHAASDHLPSVDFYTVKGKVASMDNRLLVSAVERSFLVFNLSGFPLGAGERAVLKIFLSEDSKNYQGKRTISVIPLSSRDLDEIGREGFGEGTLFAPSLSNEQDASSVEVDGTARGRYWEADVTDIVRRLVSADRSGRIGFMLVRLGENASGDTLRFSDSDPVNDIGAARGGKSPVLVIGRAADHTEMRTPAPADLFADGTAEHTPRLRGFTVRFDAGETTFHDARRVGANAVRLMLSPIYSGKAEEVWQQMLERLPGQIEAAKADGVFVIVSLFNPPVSNYRELKANGRNGYADWLWHSPEALELMKRQAVETAHVLKPYAGHVWLELKNEPLDWNAFPNSPANWPKWSQEIVDAVRGVSDVPLVVQVGPGGLCWGFKDFPLLKGNEIIYSVHNYQPHAYTHQGVKNLEGTDLKQTYDEIRRPWPGYFQEDSGHYWDKNRLRKEFEPVLEFAKRNGVRIYVGEFGVARWAPDAEQYLRDNIDLFEEFGWDWTYHAFRESHIWSFEHDEDYSTYKDAQRASTPTRREQLIRSYLARNDATSG